MPRVFLVTAGLSAAAIVVGLLALAGYDGTIRVCLHARRRKGWLT